MTQLNDYSKTKQIKGLLSVIGLGVLAALALSLSMLYYYGPQGTYRVENLLLTPDNAVNLSFLDPSSKSKERTVFDHFDFSYFDTKAKIRRVVPVELEDYARFYSIIKNDTSLNEIDDSFVHSFGQPLGATLTLLVKRPGNIKNIFSTVEFSANGNSYRISIRQHDKKGQDWVYYDHPGILHKATATLIL